MTTFSLLSLVSFQTLQVAKPGDVLLYFMDVYVC